MDLVGCVMSLDMVVSQGCLAQVPGRPTICVMRPRLTFRASGGCSSLGYNPPWRGQVYCQRHTFFRGMPMGPEAFLCIFRLWPSVRAHLKVLVPYSSICWGMWQIPSSSSCRETLYQNFLTIMGVYTSANVITNKMIDPRLW